MKRQVDVAIIGAGTAGLSAFKEASKVTENVVIIDNGPLGTTCARIGCMPSKVLIQAANYFHHRHHFNKMGIKGADKVHIDMPATLAYVRSMRDHFTKGVIEYTQSLDERFICARARFLSSDTIEIDDQTIHAKAIIIAPGSRSIVPAEWQSFQNRILTSETIFEQKDVAEAIAVIGAGSIGLEFGQALARLGVDVSVYNAKSFIGGLSDPKVNEVAINVFREEFPLLLNKRVSLSLKNDRLHISGDDHLPVEQVVAAMGRASNIDSLGLDQLGIPFDDAGMPLYDKTTMQIENTAMFVAGDVNNFNPLLHEAADEGRIAGYNAVHTSQCFQRRTPLRILFTEPNIAIIGQSYRALDLKSTAIGEVDFSDQGRAKIMQMNKGLLRVYGKKKTGELVGAELIAPGGEHIAHLLAWAIYKKLTVFDVLQMPFYHPVLEEGMRTALRHLAKQVERQSPSFDLAMCNSAAIETLS